LGEDGEAENLFREAIRLDPADAKGYFSLGRHLAERDRLDEALACLENARRLDPGNPATEQTLELALRRKADLAREEDR
jgi:superkiller protein 3